MSEYPLISLIVPVYQVRDTIEECLASIAAQTYRNLDVILVDDGSTDGSSDICNRFAAADSRFRVVRQENGGLAAARNTGLDQARGSLVGFLDSDDCLAPNHFAMLWNLIDEQHCDVAVTNLTVFESDLGPEKTVSEIQTLSASDAVRTVFYQGAFDTCAPAKLYRAALWQGIRFPEGYIHEDLPTVYRVLLRAGKVCFQPSNTYGYRFSADGLNHSKTTSRKVRTLDLVELIPGKMAADHPDLVRAAECFYCSFCFHLLLNADKDSLPVADRARLERAIRSVRGRVLSDASARKKTRVACALSYAGMGVVRLAFSAGKVLR